MSKITESARDEICCIRLPGICTHDRSTTVWCHANGSAAGKGVGMKSNDLLGAYGCSACHAVVDRQVQTDLPRPVVEVAFWQGHARSLLLLLAKGIIRFERGTVVVSNGE
jgi:Protein of unknown function (DUF1364)